MAVGLAVAEEAVKAVAVGVVEDEDEEDEVESKLVDADRNPVVMEEMAKAVDSDNSKTDKIF